MDSDLQPGEVWGLLKAIQKIQSGSRRSLVPVENVRNVLSSFGWNDDKAHFLEGYIDLPVVRTFVKQDKTGRKIGITEIGLQAIGQRKDEFRLVTSHGPAMWIYYSCFKLSSDPPHIILHVANCPHCNNGKGHGGEKALRENPTNAEKLVLSNLLSPIWIGPFANRDNAIAWWKEYCLPYLAQLEQCGHCSRVS